MRPGGASFERVDSAYYASTWRHVRGLRREYELRARHGFPVRWLDADAVRAQLGFRAPAALLSTLAAQADPYRLCQRLLHRLQRGGAGVHDRTPISRIVAGSRGVELRTGHGHAVRARYLVVAAGYAGQRLLGIRVARNRSSYAFVSDPVDADALRRLRRTVLWETARPYLYLRTTPDRRVIAGGEDDAVDIPARRDARVAGKTAKLRGRVHALFPGIALQPAFGWAGTFAETEDGLPFFGPHPKHGPRVHFAMAYGGNGITYSMLGAGLLRALIERRRHPLARLFGFARLG